MDITEAQLTWICGCILIAGLLLTYPALTSAIGLLRAERALGKLFWHFVTRADRRRDRS